MPLHDIDPLALDAELAACGHDEDALAFLVKRHLAETAYIFANFMELKMRHIPRGTSDQNVREHVLKIFQEYQQWVVESLLLDRFERLGISSH